MRSRASRPSPGRPSLPMILIAGAGIGGLTLGCALAHQGRAFRIFERAPALRPAGAGIALADNAFRALAHVGLDARVRGCGEALSVAAICRPSGRAISGFRSGDLGLGSTVAMSRSRLQEALAGALDRDVETGRTVSGYEHTTGGVRVRFDDGEVIEGEVLVGADGLHSRVRHEMLGESPLRYAGQTSWRALTRNDGRVEPGHFTETWGPGRRFGIVPIGDAGVYWYAVADAPAGGRDAADPREALQRMFAGWHAPIAALMTSTAPEAVLRADIFDRPPVATWVDRRAVLLGDAAHPMTPNLGMGGCQAIEDAVVLADAIGRASSIEEALPRYQAARVPRANSFVERSRRMGQVAHLRSAPMRWLRDAAMGLVPVRLAARALARDLDFRL